MLVLAELALATGAMTITLCKAKVTASIRKALKRSKFIEEMLSCLYCTSHWTAALLIALTRPDLGFDTVFADMVVAWFSTVTLASVAMFLIWWAHSSMSFPAEDGGEH